MQLSNHVDISGRIGKELDLKSTQSGKKALSFSIALSEKYKKDGVDCEKTDWINIVAWEKTAELIHDKAKKGDLIRIVGKLQTRNWENQQGQKRSSTDVICNEFRLYNYSNNETKQNKEQTKTDRPMNDDIPF